MAVPRFDGCWFLTGHTASGKSAAAMKLAERLPIEIVALDSMTLYRGLDIGTAKPTGEERRRVPHHLVDVLDARESFTVDAYLKAAERAVAEIRSRGRQPLFVGGTPLYLKACLRGLFDGPPADEELRTRLEAEAAERGSPALHERLRACDPAAAERIAPGDLRRIVRALEVFETTGRPISDWQREFDRPADPAPPVACLVHDREERRRRIDRRVDAMLEEGWVEEVRRLRAAGGLARGPAQAVGYAEIRAHLDGELEAGALAERIKLRTWKLAKQQMTWFRHLEEVRVWEWDPGASVDAMATRLEAFFAEADQ